MSARKDHARMLRSAQRAGCTVEVRRSGHVRVTLPDGTYVTTSASPSDANAAKQLLRDLRRAGIDLSLTV